MADEEIGAEAQLTFNIKSSSDQKYVVTVPETMTVLELKTKLSTTEYADIPPERQRLIYSGRVLKDPDALSNYKIKDGNTVHMVKGAASNARQNPASQSSSVSGATSNPAASGVPQNIAAGTGNDPLAALTGARYAGFAQMPGASTFGPDGGMGPPPNPEDMLQMLDNPMFQSQMNEAMNNPAVIQMMQNSPMLRNNPMLRQMLENPEMRRMMMDPNVLRQSMQMQRMMGGGGGGSQGIAPGVTDTTPQQQGGAQGTGSSPTPGNSSQPPPMFNPLAFMGQGGASGAAGAANPFSALFGSMNPAANPSSNTDTANTANSTNTTNQQQQANPFSSLFGGGMGDGQQNNPMAAMAQQMMQNPEAMNNMMASLFGGQQGSGGAGAGAGAGAVGFNPFAMFGGGAGSGAGAGGAFGGSPFPAPQQDTRPPEEQYSEQLRQLNDMGFYDFTSNVRALRMSGGSVQGAVEVLLSG